MDIRDYLRVLRAGGALLVIGVLLGGAVALGISLALPEQYTAGSQLFVTTTGSSDIAQAVQGNQYTEQKVASYAKLLTSKELATLVIDDLGLDLRPDELIGQIEAEVVRDTTILDVSVTDRSPQRARDIVDSIDAEFRGMVRRLESTPGQEVTPVRVSVVAAPDVPQSPSSPALIPNVALGVVVGFVLAGALAVLRDRLDTTVKDDAVASETSGAPVIGHLPEDATLAGRHVIEPHSTSSASEAIRQVRTNLAFLDVDAPPRSIMVTSSVPGEGKSTLAVNLALALTESGNSVALVEADLRRPKVTRYLGLVDGAGVTSVLTRGASLEDVLQDGGGGLRVLASGPIPPNPSELLSSDAMAALVEQLVAKHDIVVIDAPPVLPVADASAMAGLVDGVLLCARWGVVTTAQLERSAAVFDRLGAHLLGVVLTIVPSRASSVVYGYHYLDPAQSRGRFSWLQGLRRTRDVRDEFPPLPPIRPRRTTARASTAVVAEAPERVEARPRR
jgi:capsular exopolysaccharide synthesis family protein